MKIKKLNGSFIIEVNGLPYNTVEGDKYYNETLESYKANPEAFEKEAAIEEKKPTYADLRKLEYPRIEDQLDMMYHDKINGTNLWIEYIGAIKNKYPKN